MPYRKRKTGSKKQKRERVGSSGQIEVYYVDVPVYEDVWEPDSGSQSYDTDTSFDSYGGYGTSE